MKYKTKISLAVLLMLLAGGVFYAEKFAPAIRDNFLAASLVLKNGEPVHLDPRIKTANCIFDGAS